MTRTLDEQFTDAAALALRQFPEDAGKRHEYHVELLQSIARGFAFRESRMVPLQVKDWPGAGML